MRVPLGDTYYFKFSTRSFSTGAPTTLAGTPVVSIYEENNLTQITTGVTLTVDYDSVTGLHQVAVVATSGNGYEVGKYYDAVITTGTVGGVSVVGETIKHFRIMPAEDAGAGITDVNVTSWNDSAVAVPTVAGVPEVDVTHWIGTAAATPTVAGVPEVDLTHWLGSAAATPTVAGVPEVDVTHFGGTSGTFSVGRAEVNTSHWAGTATTISATTSKPEIDVYSISDDASAANNAELDYDGTGYNKTNSTIGTCTTNTDMRGTDSALLAASAPTNFGDLSITATTGRIDVGSWLGTAVTTSSTTLKPEVDIYSVSDDATAANNLELQYDTTGLTGSTFPATQAQLTNIVAVGAATNVPAESYVLTTGTQSANTYTATASLDAVRHEHTDTAGVMELYYQFDIGGDGAPVSTTMVGYLVSANDVLGVYAYNWTGASWDQIGILQGGPAADSTATYALYAGSHVGTGANLGKVRIRFYAASGLTTATLAIDQLYVSYATVSQTVGYANGSFWINTVNGTAGTVAYFNATADKPVDTLTDAQTLSATVPLNIYTVSNDSSITLSAAFDSSIMTGSGYTLAFGGQSVNGSRIVGAFVSGTCTGASGIVLSNCVVAAVTLPIAAIENCNIETGITFGSAGEYHLHNSHCGNANGVYMDFGAALGDNQLLVHGWQGELELRNMGQLGTDVAHVAGDGILTIAASCIGGTVYYQGDWDFTDNSGGAVTFVKSDYNNNIAAILTDTGTTLPATLGTPAGADLATDIASIQSDTTAILVDTGTTIPATLGTPAGADMSTDIASIKTDTGTTLPALIRGPVVQKNAALNNFEFLMVLTSDHVTPATGLVVTGQRSIDGGAFSAVSGAIAEVSNGIYQFDALAADTNGDLITWRFSSATADDTFVTFKTVS